MPPVTFQEGAGHKPAETEWGPYAYAGTNRDGTGGGYQAGFGIQSGTAGTPAPAATGTPAPSGGTSALILGDPASINSPTLVGQLSPAQLAAFVGIDPPAGYAGTGNQAVHPFHVAPIVA